MANHEGTRWRGQLPVPPHAHPLVRTLIEAANEQDTTLTEIAKRSGVTRCTISGWRYTSIPRLDLFEAALSVLDLELCIRPKAVR